MRAVVQRLLPNSAQVDAQGQPCFGLRAFDLLYALVPSWGSHGAAAPAHAAGRRHASMALAIGEEL
eukprot:1506882-Lingulodinium_polyedra.AAC.1